MLIARSPASSATTWQKYRLPLGFLALMSVMIALTPPQNPLGHARAPLEWVAHYLGHGINSVWIGVSLLLLALPSLWQTFVFKRSDLWAWRALDAIWLDVFAVDVLGKHEMPFLIRPINAAHPEMLRAGFPSGHATFQWLVAWMIWRRFPRLGPLYFAMAALVSWSRIESHAHFPYQVFGGALIGCALSALICQSQGAAFARLALWSCKRQKAAPISKPVSEIQASGAPLLESPLSETPPPIGERRELEA